MEEILNVFSQEAREQLTAMEDGLLLMEQGDNDADLLNAIFRAAHTIKGAAGVVELHHIEHFTHVLENLLDRLRNHELKVNSDMITLLLQGCDHIGVMLLNVEQGRLEEDPELTIAGLELSKGLGAFGAQVVNDMTANVTSDNQAVHNTGMGGWKISVRFGSDVLKMGMDPLNFLRYLEQLGEIIEMSTQHDDIPQVADFDAELCYLGFEINLRSNANQEAIENVFAFCRDDCELSIQALGDTAVVQVAEVAEVVNEVHGSEAVEATKTKNPVREKRNNVDTRLIRVQAEKLDQLIDLVGELVIAGASASLLARQSAQLHLIEANSVLSRLVEDIRDSALQLRMVQIGETFNRFNRVVRDTSREIGKDIELIIKGADTELDKSVVEKIGDPLMHLVRNAMDHGIESAEQRQAAGKPVHGRLELNAYHDSGSIIIEVLDDGGGINTRKVEAKAIERGLIPAIHNLTDQEIVNLVFEAGFSTVDAVSNLSGRGVGMDVVRRNIQALRGSVEVKTWPGEGSCFTIRLPLTLALIDGFLTTVGDASYVIPLDSVVECLDLQADATRGDMLNLRGEVLPFIRLRDFFGIAGEPPARENVVVIISGSVKAGIIVDQLLGEFQTVIKSLGHLFRHLRGIGGSTILGSGEVALILDVQALTQLAVQREEKSFSSEQILSKSVHSTYASE